MAQRLVALDKQVAPALSRPGVFVLSGGPKFMTNRAEGLIMYHPPPGSHGSMANCVARLMKHLTPSVCRGANGSIGHILLPELWLLIFQNLCHSRIVDIKCSGFLPKQHSDAIGNLLKRRKKKSYLSLARMLKFAV